MQATLLMNPRAGAVIPGTNGRRKLRWGSEGWQTGGLRVIYYVVTADDRCLMLYLHPNRAQESLEPDELRARSWYVPTSRAGDVMEKKMFDALVESIEEMGAYLRGEAQPARVTVVGEPDPRAIRAKLGMTQEEFAAALGISVKTLRNWEQGRRDPSGPAMRLLRIAERNPEILREPVA